MAILDKLTLNNRIRRLNNCKSDLCDDHNAIQYYNKKIDATIEDFQSFVRTGNAEVVNRLANYREPYQDSDGSLVNARNYIQYEINSLDRQKRALDSDNGGGGFR